MQTRSDQEAKDKVLELVKDANIAMMATRSDDGVMRARPMGTNTVDFDGYLWFFTDIDSPKVAEVRRDPEVLLTYSDETKQNYVSISGKGEVVQDKEKAKQLWTETLRVWFPKGVDDPRIGLIKVQVDLAEYWDSPSSTMLHAYGYLKAVTTGERPKGGENATVRF